jgi:predicted phage terminase large subunit-like protein
MAFMLSDEPEVFFGGSAGGGKSDALLMAALMFAEVPGYDAIIFRRTYPELSMPGGLLERSHEWLKKTQAHWSGMTKTWTFPSGATVSFGHMENENDRFNYKSAEFQFCVAEGTLIKMGTGKKKCIEDVSVGDFVQTLEGPRVVKKTFGSRIADCVLVRTACGNSQVHPKDHSILTASGWISYASALSLAATTIGIHETDKFFSPFGGKYRSLSRKHDNQYEALKRRSSLFQSYPDRQDDAVPVVFSGDHQTCFSTSDDERQAFSPPQELTVLAVLHVPYRHPNHVFSERYVVPGGRLGSEAIQDCQSNCWPYCYPNDERFLCQPRNGPDVFPLPADAEEHNLSCCIADDLGRIRYAHPYTKEWRSSTEAVRLSPCSIRPVGKRMVYDIQVADVNHYITSSNLVNMNCGFDELTSFLENQYTYLFSRLRKNIDSFVPLRMRSASNPGDIGHEWVKKRFVVPEIQNKNCRFIKSTLEDNPTLNYDEYVASLSHLDTITKQQLLEGKWVDVRGNRFFPSQWPQYADIGDAYSYPLGYPRKICKHETITRIVGIDISLGKKKTSDLTSFICVGLTPHGDLLMLDVVDERIRFESVADRLDEFCAKWEPHIVIGDDDNLSYSMQTHYRQYPHIPEVGLMPISGQSKIVRAQAAIILGENKRIFLPESQRTWYNDFVDKLAAFTGVQEEHDDVVDALSCICRKVNQLKPQPIRRSSPPLVLVPGKCGM